MTYCINNNSNDNNKEQVPLGNKTVNINLFTNTSRISTQANKFYLQQILTTFSIALL